MDASNAAAGARLPAELRTFTRTPIATALLRLGNHTERVSIGLAPSAAVRLPAVVSVPDAVRAAHDIMGFPSPSWAVAHAKDGTRFLVPTVTIGAGGRPTSGFNIDSAAVTVLSLERTSDVLDALVGYRTARVFAHSENLPDHRPCFKPHTRPRSGSPLTVRRPPCDAGHVAVQGYVR